MKRSLLAAVLTGLLCATCALASDDGPVVGVVDWEPARRPDATSWDKTDYWACIAVSPSTGKYAASCEWMARENASRQARERCNARDAKAVVLCCNGWCALSLGRLKDETEYRWGVGWGPDRRTAEKFALEEARDHGLPDAKVTFSINAREMRTGGAIAYSESTGAWGWGTGGGRSASYNALKNCKAPDAKVIAQKADCWMALALGDDKTAYGWGHAGNRADAEANALDECRKRTTKAKIAVSFCTNGVEEQ